MDELLTASELAKLFKIKPQTIYVWVHQGYVPHIKLGKCVRFQKEAVLNWLEKKQIRGRLQRKYPLEN